MPYSAGTKRAARAGQGASEWTRSICGAIGIEGNHRYLYAAAFFDLLAKVTGRIATDPPRRDYTVSTRTRLRFATPSHIATEDEFEQLALEAAERADDAEVWLAAHLRAFERTQGARKAQREAEAGEREAEAVRYAEASGQALHQLAAPLTEIAGRLAERPEPGERSGHPRLGEVSEEALAVLFLGGLRIRDLENVLSGTRLEDRRVAGKGLLESAQTFDRLGTEMEGWTPPEQPELSLQAG